MQVLHYISNQPVCVRFSHNLLQAQISGLGIDDPSRAQVAIDSHAQGRSSSYKVFLAGISRDADEITTTEFFKKYGNLTRSSILAGVLFRQVRHCRRDAELRRQDQRRGFVRSTRVRRDQQTDGRHRPFVFLCPERDKKRGHRHFNRRTVT